MRIAFISYDDRELCKDYSNATPFFGSAPAALYQGFENLSDHEVHVISCAMQPMRSPEKIASNIWFHSLHVPNIGWLKTGYQGCIRKIRQTLSTIKPDIVHGQGTERYCAISAVFSGFPAIITVHGNMRLIAQVNHAGPLSFLWLTARLEAFTLPRARGVLCISKHTQRAVSDLAQSTWVVPNAVNRDFFAVRTTPFSTARPKFLCVGRVCPLKNQNALIRALEPLSKDCDFELVFLGAARQDNPYGAEFFDLVRRNPWCRYEGFAKNAALRDHFHQASALVLSSIEDNCPMVILEAMATGLPVVASKVGGIPELVQDGRTGILCDPAEMTSFAAAIKRLMIHKSDAASMGREAKEAAESNYHPAKIAGKHLEIYEEVLKR